MRLAALGFSHETNTFARQPTTYAHFAETELLHGDEIVATYANSQATMAGFLAVREMAGVEVAPLFFARTNPSGTITRSTFERLLSEMLELLAEHGPWDGVLLGQHGAAVAEDYPDADGEVAARVRELVGPDVPIGLSIDMHANVSRQMVDRVDVMTIYRTNPHIDPRERALECAELIVRTARGEIRPVQWLEMPPTCINIVRQYTGWEPMKSILGDLETVLARPRILTASVAEGYPYADVEEMGMAFLAVADGNADDAREAAEWLASRAWDRRSEFVGDVAAPEEALSTAVAAGERPVVLMDVGDNIGGGSPADSTILLALAKQLGIRSYLQSLRDPEAAQACIATGVGARVTLSVGAKTDDMHGQPVEVSGVVRGVGDGKFEDPGPTHGGIRFYDQGPTAVLDTDDGHTLVLHTHLLGNTSREQMYSVGVRPEEYQIVVAKGVQSPRPAYEPIAAQIILVNTPGVTTADLSNFTYARRRVPLYPFEPDATYARAAVRAL